MRLGISRGWNRQLHGCHKGSWNDFISIGGDSSSSSSTTTLVAIIAIGSILGATGAGAAFDYYFVYKSGEKMDIGSPATSGVVWPATGKPTALQAIARQQTGGLHAGALAQARRFIASWRVCP